MSYFPLLFWLWSEFQQGSSTWKHWCPEYFCHLYKEMRSPGNFLWDQGLSQHAMSRRLGASYHRVSQRTTWHKSVQDVQLCACVHACVCTSQQFRSVRFPRGRKTLGKFPNTLGFPIKSENCYGHHNSGRENLHCECPWRPPHVPVLLIFRRIPGWQSLKTEVPLHAQSIISHKTSDSVRDNISHEADSKRVGTGRSRPSRASVPPPPWA